MNKQLKFGVILQYAQMILSALISLIITPIILKLLGSSEYGLYNLSSSIISYLSLFSLGFGSSYIRFYTIQKKNNPEKIGSLNGLYLFVFSIIGVLALAAGLILSQNVGIFLNDTYSNSEHQIAKILFVILTVNLSISFPASVFTSYITSQENFIFLKLISLGKTVLSPIVSLCFLLTGFGSIGLVFSASVVSILVDIISIIFCLKKLKMQISFKNMNFGYLKEIFVFSIFIAINSLVDQINWQTDKIILGKALTSVAVAVYGIGSTINSIYLNISVAISNVFSPRINKIVQNGGNNVDEKLTKLMTDIGMLQFCVLTLILSGFIFFGKYFIYIWVGPDFEESFYVALLLMCPATIALIQNAGIEIQRAKNLHKFRSIAYLIIAIINIGISIWFCKLWGVVGVALGTTISLIVGNGIIINFYYHYKVKLNMRFFWSSILKLVPSILIPICVGVLMNVHGINSLINFIVFILIYSLIYIVCIYFFVYKKGKLVLLKKENENEASIN